MSIDEYLDSNGLVTFSKDKKVTGNGVRYSVDYLISKYYDTMVEPENYLLLLNQKPEDPIIDPIRKCEHPKHKGLWMRTPDNKFGNDSIDNYLALSVLSFYFDRSIASRIMAYGERTKPKHYYNNVTTPKMLRPWLGRFPQLICNLTWAEGMTPTLLQRIWWIGSVLFNSLSKKQDSVVLTFYLCLVGMHQGWLYGILNKWRVYWLEYNYPNGIGEVLEEYAGFQHPIAKEMYGRF